MSRAKNLAKTGSWARYSVQPFANLIRNFPKVLPKQNTPKPTISSFYDPYNNELYPEKPRYVLKDKSPYGQSCKALNDIRKNIKENAYFTMKSSKEQRKCFENIQSVQTKWYAVKRRNNIVAQTVYDPEKPNLWLRVKYMYRPNLFYPRTEYRLQVEKSTE